MAWHLHVEYRPSHWFVLEDPHFARVFYHMMTSSIGNIFRVTGPLRGESTGHWWIPLTKASDMKLWCFPWCAPKQTVKQAVDMLMIWDAVALIITSLQRTSPWTESSSLQWLVACSIKQGLICEYLSDILTHCPPRDTAEFPKMCFCSEPQCVKLYRSGSSSIKYLKNSSRVYFLYVDGLVSS